MSSPLQQLVTVAALTVAGVAHAGDHVLLNATFDHETVGALVGTGGAAAGEPVSLFCHGDATPADCAIIATSPFATPNLQIRDTDTYYAQTTTFGFLDDEEVTTGTVQIRAQVLFTGSGQPEFGLREQGGAAQNFLDFYAGDGNPYLGAYTGSTFHGGLGQYTPNVILPLAIDASADQMLLSLRLGGITLLDSVTIDLTTARGIGSILIGNSNTVTTPADVMRVDNLRVVACTSTVFADCVFVDGFDH
jgi:hypothetical protein